MTHWHPHLFDALVVISRERQRWQQQMPHSTDSVTHQYLFAFLDWGNAAKIHVRQRKLEIIPLNQTCFIRQSPPPQKMLYGYLHNSMPEWRWYNVSVHINIIHSVSSGITKKKCPFPPEVQSTQTDFSHISRCLCSWANFKLVHLGWKILNNAILFNCVTQWYVNSLYNNELYNNYIIINYIIII